jgi:DNA-binding NarL/FixJ family response regulator
MDAKRQIHIVIADDHPIVRQGLRQVIEAAPGLLVVAEAEDGQAALARVQAYRPDIAVLDIDMPKMDGFAVALAIRDQQLGAAVIFLTIHREKDFFNEHSR